MTRLAKFVLVFVSAFGSAVASPSTSEAGIIPWMYDAIFGPVGSLRSGSGYGYRTYGAGYPGYGYGANYGYGYGANYGMGYGGYAPMSSAYSPMGYGSYGGGGGGCNCGQSSYYAPTSAYDQSYIYSPTQAYSGMPTGGCASGNCQNCVTNSVPTTNYGDAPPLGTVGAPTRIAPDANNAAGGSNINQSVLDRLDKLEYEHRHHQEYLKKNSDFSLPEYSGSSTRTYGETVPQHKTKTIDSDQINHVPPRKTRPLNQIDDRSQGTQKPVLPDPPTPAPPATDTPPANNDGSGSKPTGQKPEEDRQGLLLLNVLTSRPVTPRQRMQPNDRFSNSTIAKSTKKTGTPILDTSLTIDVTRR